MFEEVDARGPPRGGGASTREPWKVARAGERTTAIVWLAAQLRAMLRSATSTQNSASAECRRVTVSSQNLLSFVIADVPNRVQPHFRCAGNSPRTRSAVGGAAPAVAGLVAAGALFGQSLLGYISPERTRLNGNTFPAGSLPSAAARTCADHASSAARFSSAQLCL